MKGKPVVRSERATRDIEVAVEHYISTATEKQSLKFVSALEEASSHISRFPATGSSRYGHELHLPSLRSWRVKDFPYLVFYVERDDHIDLWRVLHTSRDIPAGLSEGLED